MISKLQVQNWKTRVKVHLVEREISVSGLASAIGYPRNSVSIAINSQDRLPGVKNAINSYLKIK